MRRLSEEQIKKHVTDTYSPEDGLFVNGWRVFLGEALLRLYPGEHVWVWFPGGGNRDHTEAEIAGIWDWDLPYFKHAHVGLYGVPNSSNIVEVHVDTQLNIGYLQNSTGVRIHFGLHHNYTPHFV